MAIGYGQPCPKPTPRVFLKAQDRQERERKAQRFRNAVWARDKHTCQVCGQPVRRTLELIPNRGEVHHLRGRNVAPEDRYNVDQAVLLCAVDHVRAQRHEIVIAPRKRTR